MKSEAEPWLPDSAFLGPASVEPVAAIVGEWSDTWLASARARVPFRWEMEAARNQWSGASSPIGNGFRVTIVDDGEVAIAGAILDRTIEPASLRTAADRFVGEQIVSASLDDLKARLTRYFEPVRERLMNDAGSSAGDTCSLPVLLNDDFPLLTIEAERRVLIAKAKARARAPRPGSPLHARKQALVDQVVGLSTVVGRTRIGLAELEMLGVGDVLKLDTTPEALLDICAGENVLGRGVASLGMSDRNFTVRIERPISEW